MWEPLPDRDAAGAVGETLRELGYDEEAIEDRLGEDGIAAEADDALAHARRLEQDELGDAIRLLLLARPVARTSFAASAELVRLGLATEDGPLLVPRARIVPTEGVYLAFDTFRTAKNDPLGLGRELHPDRVLARVADAAPARLPRARHRDRERRARAARGGTRR